MRKENYFMAANRVRTIVGCYVVARAKRVHKREMSSSDRGGLKVMSGIAPTLQANFHCSYYKCKIYYHESNLLDKLFLFIFRKKAVNSDYLDHPLLITPI
uniref:Uncharacterized protein n=1 Tax=Clastoptera arizonana TaxID=38151 RepID=A0A1B6DST8_9HEMI